MHPNDQAFNDEIEIFRSLVEGVAGETGDAFFGSLVQNLARALRVEHAFVAEFTSGNRVRTRAYCSAGKIVENIEWDVRGTPCEEVVKGKLCHHPRDVARLFPEDKPLARMGVESYLGVPLVASDGQHLGHLAVFDPNPMPDEPRRLLIFRVFAARAAAELARLKLERELAEAQERFRDLFDEAPIAYVHEGLDSRFIRANRAAMRSLGITPEQVEGTYGFSFIADTPENKRRVKEAFESIGRGTDTGGVVLELRRRDNGKPLWIQWWSKPDVSGKYTRTMFVDITEKVLMEQEQARLKAQNQYLQEEIKSVHNFDEIIGASASLQKVLESVRRVAPTDASVLICGETGTGKELIARAVHSASNRADRPFVKVNCAALPAGLVESELFGHERGAFSGAIQRRIGRFELANTGTIFLDEIGEVPLDVQVKLLRVLQEREFERLGGAQTIRADVRVIAATNRDLRQSIRDGEFREDLFYRLNVFPLELPPLRRRIDDLPLLVQFFVQKYAARIGRRIDSIEPATQARLAQYHWPGNIRELENVVERAVILANSPTLHIGSEVLTTSAPPADQQPKSDLNAQQRDHILRVLVQTNWIIEGERGAAKALGLHPNTLRSRMKKLGLARPRDSRG